MAEPAWQQQAGAELRAQADVDERHAQLGVAGDQYLIAMQQQCGANTDGQPLNLRHNGLWEHGDHAQKPKNRRIQCGGWIAQKIAQVVACRKTALMAFEQHHFDCTAVGGIAKGISQRYVHGVGE